MKIYAHRGNSGFYPENTMYAFKKSLDLDIYGIELDVHKTKDGVIVVHHDETVDRMFDGQGTIKKLTFDQIKDLTLKDEEFKLNPECKISTLEDVLIMLEPTKFNLNIELKNDKVSYKNLEVDVINLIKKYNLEKRVLISSFNHKSLKKCKKINSKIPTGYLLNPEKFKKKNLKKVLKIAKDCNCSYIHPSYDIVDKEFVESAHKKGFLVQVYTVNSVTIMRKLIKLKVDGVFTNYPKIINTIVNEK